MKWECPNGDNCHYMHRVPEGYVIQSDKDKVQQEMTAEEYVNLEEKIDEERAIISETGTPVTEETFMAWKKKREEEKEKIKLQNKQYENKKKETGLELFRNKKINLKEEENEEVEEEKEEEDDKKCDQGAAFDGVVIDKDIFVDEVVLL